MRTTATGLALRTPVSDAEVAWGAYRACVSRRGYWYLRQTTGPWTFVPQFAFLPKDRAAVDTFLNSRFPQGR